MEKKIAILGNSGAIYHGWLKNTQQVFAESGENTGNMAFWYAVNKYIPEAKDFISWSTTSSTINQNYRALVMVAANWIGPHTDLQILANMVADVTVPIIVIGLGAQAGLGASKVEIKSSTQRLLDILTEKNAYVGTRGAFSAEIVKGFGVKNVEVTGCPSNLINSRPDLGKLIEQKLKNISMRRLALNFDLGGTIVPYVKNFAKWLENHGGQFICQNPIGPIRLARNDYDPELDREYIEKVRGIVAPHLDYASFLNYMATYFQIYYTADTWMSYLSTCNLSLGSRLHGNILAFQAGTPAIIIPHDSRTDELARTVKIPLVTLEKAAKCETPEQLVEQVEFDGASYDENRKILAGRIINLLKTADIKISAELEGFIK